MSVAFGSTDKAKLLAKPAWTLMTGMAIAIYGIIVLSNEVARASTHIAPMWLAPAILLTALLRHDQRNWRAFVLAGGLAAVAANLATGKLLRDALLHGAINTVAPWLVAMAMVRLGDTSYWYTSKRWIFRFVLASLAASALSASVGATWRVIFQGAPFFHVWPEWFVSNSLGYIMGTLFLMSWTEPALRQAVTSWRLIETAILTGLVTTVSYVAFTTTLPLLFLVYPALALTTLRARLPGATAGTLAFATVAIWSMVEGVGPIATLSDLSAFQRALILRGCLLTGLLSTIPIAVILTLRETYAEKLMRQGMISNVALDNMMQGLCMFDREERLVICNRRYIEMYNLPPHLHMPGTACAELLQHHVLMDGGVSATDQWCSEVISRLRSNQSRTELELADGRKIEVQHRLLPDGGWVSTHEDVTESRRAAQQISYLAHYDPLTDLPNRTSFREHLQRSLLHAERGHDFALHCLDLDRFKSINDTLGHGAGDELLRQVAGRLRETVRNSDLVVRLGGDEFAIIQFPLDSPADAGALAERVVEVLRTPYSLNGHEAVIGASVGIAVSPADGQNAAELVQRGDLALYRAKSDGRNTYCYFEPGMDNALHRRRLIEVELRAAVQKGEFELHYQPIMNIESQEITCLEALLRWRHPVRGLILPEEFIAIAEESGLILSIGEWVIRHACREAASWPCGVKLAVNLSAAQFKGRNLAALVINAAKAARFDPGRLELEITESVLLQDSDDVFATLNELHEAGIGIAMDDFGTGYSSLGNLRCFPFDKIKIDRSFVRNLDEEESRAIVHATTELSTKLGMRTTAEGVETAEQLAIIQSEGCTEVQGFYVSEPLEPADISGLLARFPPRSPSAALKVG